MGRPLIVIADTDENYLITLENRLIGQFDDNVDLEIISDREYFQSFFSVPRTAEIVAVDEKLYNKDLQKHNISNLFVFTEQTDNIGTEETAVNVIFKYTGIKEIINELLYRSKEKLFTEQKKKDETKIISFYSAVGGSGKTALSIGLAASLVQNHYRVLYINTESIQNFSWYLYDQSFVTSPGYKIIRENRMNLYQGVKNLIRKEGFSYLPPFSATLDIANLDYGIFLNLIKTAQESNDFDYIVVDIEAGYQPERLAIINSSDKVIITTMQDEASLNKTSYLVKNFDFQNKDKYLFICNKFQNGVENHNLNGKGAFQIDEYIELVELPLKKVQDILQIRGIQRLAYTFI